MFIYRAQSVSTRSRALTLASLAILITLVLVGLPQFLPSNLAAPFEANQTLNWIQTGQNAFNQGLYIRQLVKQGSRIWAATDGYGVFYTDNGGQTWGEILDGLSRDNRSTKTVLLTPNAIFAGTSGGVYKSPYNNLALTAVNNGLVFNGTQVNIFTLVSNGTDILAGSSNTVFRSTDNGANWTRVNSGITNGMTIPSIFVHSSGIYAGSDYNGVYKSTDNGLSWNWMSNGLVAGRVNAFLQVGNTLLAGTGYEGIFRSINGAESWEKVGSGLTGNASHVHDLLLIGSDIYAATEDGVYRSSDVGVSFQPVKTGLTGLGLFGNTLVYVDNYLYVGTEGGGMYRALLGAQPTPTPTPSPTPTPIPTPTPTPSPSPTPTVSPTPTPTPNGRVVQVQSGGGLPGGSVTLAVNLTAQGNENTVGFSVNFDPAVLSYQSSAKGTDATSLLKNELSAAQGRVGLAATVDQGQSFPAGSRQLATLTFNIASNATVTSTALTLGDQPIPRQVVAPDAGSLTPGTSFLGGSISIQNGYEGDVSPRPTGKNTGAVNLQDFVQIGRFAIGLDTVNVGSEFQRADCAPRASKGDGAVNLADYVQAGRFATVIDPVTTVGGPTAPSSFASAPTGEGQATNLVARQRSISAMVDSLVGSTRIVRIAIEANGDESAIGWSLNFNPSEWKFSGAVGAPLHGQIAVNASNASSGRIGLAVLLEPGATLAEGSQQIAELHFEAAHGISRDIAIDFGDRPVARQLVDRVAQALPARFAVSRGSQRTTAAAIVSSADLTSPELAAESLASAFGTGLASQSISAETLPLPTELGGTRVIVHDSLGVERAAGLLFVSPTQVNYQVPAETAPGIATVEIVTISESGESVTLGVSSINDAAPGLFTANSSGGGLAAALFGTPDASGQLTFSPASIFDAANGQWTANPIELGSGDQPVYLVLFGTGIRGSNSVRVFLGSEEVLPMYAGAQGSYAGVDQINLALPKSLRGVGDIAIRVESPGEQSNTVHVFVH